MKINKQDEEIALCASLFFRYYTHSELQWHHCIR